MVNRLGKGRFQAFSAGVEPGGEVDPLAIDVLRQPGYPVEGLRPKHWREFSGADAPVLDFVFTLSDTASRDVFPEWPGTPVSSHWPDPTKAPGDAWQRRREYARTLSSIERQMRTFMQLSFDALDRMALKKRLDGIGAAETAG